MPTCMVLTQCSREAGGEMLLYSQVIGETVAGRGTPSRARNWALV